MKNETTHQTSEIIKKFGELVAGIQVAMLTTINKEGKLKSRPMATQQIEHDGDLWFFTGIHSQKVDDLRKLHQVDISYSDTVKNRYVSVSGSAELVQDANKAKELWSPFYKAWFPKGLDDPELALLKVKIENIEYWDTPSSKMVHLIGLTKAVLTGEGYKGEGADHKELKIS